MEDKKQENLNFNNVSEIEILSKRGKREKHFLQKDGTIIARMYSDNIHFKENDKYIEIDNRLEKIQNYYKNKRNSFNVYFKENSCDNFLGYELNDGYLSFELLNNNNVPVKILDNGNQFSQTVKYENLFDGIDFEYVVTPTTLKENIVIKNKNDILDVINFRLNTNLKLELNNGSINAIKDNEVLFNLDVPYMIDSNKFLNHNVKYELREKQGFYELDLILDQNWLNSDSIVYPVTIDPTININETSNVYDVVLDEQESNKNLNDYYYLGAGVDKGYYPNQDKYYKQRSLIKFELPTIGTGSQIVASTLRLIAYGIYDDNNTIDTCVDLHRVTKNWEEATATWNDMSDKYSSHIEANTRFSLNYLEEVELGDYRLKMASFDITELTKKWYTDTPNYGILLKEHAEKYHEPNTCPTFFSKNNKMFGPAVMPSLEVVYRNQNGLESYYRYEKQQLSHGTIYENLYNGNVVAEFDIANIVGSKNSFLLKLFYNTNDVVLKNNRCGVGFKFNIQQFVEKKIIDNTDYIEYTDSDGTLHYYVKDGEVYRLEDDHDNIIKIENDIYFLTDNSGNIKKFDNSGKLMEYNGIDNQKILITYDSNNKISKIVDEDNNSIEFQNDNDITILKSKNSITKLIYTDNLLTSIEYEDGIISLSYNNHNLINKVKDVDLTSFTLDYYEIFPYKFKKITEHGLEDVIGNSFEIEYSNKVSTITDNKGRIFTISFNDFGNPLTTATWKQKNNVVGAYSSISEFTNDGNGVYSNKVLSRQYPVRYVKNYFNNADFESGINTFVSNDNIEIFTSSEAPYDGFKCLKIINNTDKNAISSYDVKVPKGQYYTFSAYISGTNESMISLSYKDEDNNTIEKSSENILTTNDYIRYDISIFYPENASSDLSANIYVNSASEIYVDNVQLEEGRGANIFNYVQNSDFSDNLVGWTGMINNEINNKNFEAVTIDGTTAAKVNLDVDENTNLSKSVNIVGDEGDTITVSFWYKNLGINTNWYRIYNNVMVGFNYTDDDLLGNDSYSQSLNPNKDQWQYFSCTYEAQGKFEGITFNLWQESQANELYVTDVSIVKGMSNDYNYIYDNKGHVGGISDSTGQLTEFSHDSNGQMVKMESCNGNRMIFEYDNKVIDRGIMGMANNGVANKMTYSKDGNITSSKIVKLNNNNEIIDGLYKIRVKGTNKYLKLVGNSLGISTDEYASDNWKIEKHDNYFSISNSILNNCYLKYEQQKLKFSNDYSLFELEKNSNGSYSIKIKDSVNYLRIKDDNVISIENFIFGSEEYQFQFYFELYSNHSFIEENKVYTDDEKYIQEQENSALRKTRYVYDEQTELISQTIDFKNNSIYYKHDNKNRISSVINGDRISTYKYNEYGKLSNIIQNDKNYKIEYDNFHNISSVKMNDIKFYENIRETNNGNILSTIYGNGDKINYEYDEFDRVKKLLKANKTYEFIYGANAELLKVLSDDYIDTFCYDIKKRLMSYRNSYFSINYGYDVNNNVVSRKYVFGPSEEKVILEFDDNNNIVKLNFDSDTINYNYDYLDRVSSKVIAGKFTTKYNYIVNGKRESILIESLSNNGDVYSYRYDKVGNITHIYHNEKLEIEYYYDCFYQLIREDNYLKSVTNYYKYDVCGNLLYKKTCKLKTNEFISQNKYYYCNEIWKDQLSKFNDDIITYDEIGNPLTIGNDIYMEWIGKTLKEYNDPMQKIIYKYNVLGIRTSKIINNVETKYCLEGNFIIYEKTNNDLIYYLRNNDGDLLGLKYNNKKYYYVKNNLDDIIQIIDEMGNIVVKYYYDAWGNILSITDNIGNEITDKSNIAIKNPFRYRSYYYDEETKLYYLNQRYYNPKWGRFISSDSEINTNPYNIGYNLYAYCDNNPVNKVDYDGNSSFFGKLVKKISNAVNKVFKIINKVIKPSKKSKNKIVKKANNLAKKAIPIIANNLTKSFLERHFYFEVGSGKGADISIPFDPSMVPEYSGYQDYTLTYQNGEWKELLTGTGSVGIGGFGYSSDYSCSIQKEESNVNNSLIYSYNIALTGNCTNPEITHSIYTPITEYNIDTGEWFIGQGYSLHVGVGHHIKIGFKF